MTTDGLCDNVTSKQAWIIPLSRQQKERTKFLDRKFAAFDLIQYAGNFFVLLISMSFPNVWPMLPFWGLLEYLYLTLVFWILFTVNRMPRNRLPTIKKHYSPTGRGNYDRPLKRLLDTWDRNGSTSDPSPWQIYDDDNDSVYNTWTYTQIFRHPLLEEHWHSRWNTLHATPEFPLKRMAVVYEHFIFLPYYRNY
jgi:hypothetical protein